MYAEKYIHMLGLVYLCNGSQFSQHPETKRRVYATSAVCSQLHSPSLFHKSRAKHAEENLKIHMYLNEF